MKRQHQPPIPLSLDGRGIKGEGENDADASSRHCGLDPQSRGAGCVAAVILASRQYPQGGATTRQHNHIPLSLDGRGIKGEGENDASHMSLRT